MLFFVIDKTRAVSVCNKKYADYTYATSVMHNKIAIANCQLSLLAYLCNPIRFEGAMASDRYCVIERVEGLWQMPRFETRHRNKLMGLSHMVRNATMEEGVALIFGALKVYGIGVLPPPEVWSISTSPCKVVVDGFEVVDEGGSSMDEEFVEVTAEDCEMSDNGSVVDSFFVNLPEINNPDAKDLELLDELLIREIVIKKK